MQADPDQVPITTLTSRKTEWLEGCPSVSVITNQYLTTLDPKLKFFRIYEIEVEPKVEKDSYQIFKEAVKRVPETVKELFREDFYQRRQNVIWVLSTRELQELELGQHAAKYTININQNEYTIALKLVKKSQLLENGSIRLPNQTKDNINLNHQAINIFIKKTILKNCKSIKECSRNVFSPKWGEFEHSDGLLTRICFKLSIEYISLTLYSEITKKIKSEFRENILNRLETKKHGGLINEYVTTLYGAEKTYVLKEFKWNLSPQSTFIRMDEQISFADYYKKCYGITLQKKQPMILVETLRKQRIVQVGNKMKLKKNEEIIIPAQLLAVTRVPYHLQNKHRHQILMQLTPNKCIEAASQFINQVNQAQNEFKISVQNRQSDARLICQPSIIINETQKIHPIDGRFNLKRRKTQKVYLNCVFIYSIGNNPDKDAKELYDHRQLLIHCGKKYNMFFDQIHYIQVERDQGLYRWIQEIDKFLEDVGYFSKEKQAKNAKEDLFFIIPLKDDEQQYYASIKTHLTYNCDIPSQMYYRSKFNLKQSISKSIASNIIKQIISKKGLPLWEIEINPITQKNKNKILVIGISILYGQLIIVSNFDNQISKFKSQLEFVQSKKIPTAKLQQKVKQILKDFMRHQQKSHHDHDKKKSKNISEFAPDIVFVYRSGLNNQLFAQDQIKSEIQIFKKYFEGKIAFIQVKSRPSQKIWIHEKSGHQQGNLLPKVTNPQVGTVMRGETDEEFYLVASKPTANQGGSAHPVWFKVAANEGKIEMKYLVEFTFWQTFNYYNFQGSVRLPQVLQYSKKLHYFPKPLNSESLSFETLSYL